jgi:hypothetical protein
MKLFRSKYVRVSIVIITWAICAFAMSIVYYKLKELGLIWDNPDSYGGSWNSRKVIVGLVAGSSFMIAVIRIMDIITDGFKNA